LQVFFLTCVFGLYFGLVFLPVVLSLFGPDPYFAASPPRGEPSKRDADAAREVVEYECVSVL
jgi:hypothetical protein